MPNAITANTTTSPHRRPINAERPPQKKRGAAKAAASPRRSHYEKSQIELIQLLWRKGLIDEEIEGR